METNPKKSNINPVADFSKTESKFWILLDSRIQKNLDYLLLWINPDYVDYCGFLNPKLIRIQSINNPEKITREESLTNMNAELLKIAREKAGSLNYEFTGYVSNGQIRVKKRKDSKFIAIKCKFDIDRIV